MSLERGFDPTREPSAQELLKAQAEVEFSAKGDQGKVPEAVLNMKKFLSGKEGKATLLEKLKAEAEINISANPESIKEQREFHQTAATVLAPEAIRRKE